MKKIEWMLPIKTVSEINSSEHWRVKNKRHKQQQFFVRSLFNHEAQEIKLPCNVKLTRLSPCLMDDDNLPTSMKYIKDEIAAQLVPEKVAYYRRKGRLISNKGHADNDSRISWGYGQEKSKRQAVRIEICFEDSPSSTPELAPSNEGSLIEFQPKTS
jgi:hypothetical protein